MSSGFVAAGTDQEPVERDDEWRRAQQELEEERRRKAELGRQEGGKSLYEVLQQNKSTLSHRAKAACGALG
jgi:acyl-CoA reductase-like NAD-dependent aldehyde dehydrogenase